jgi:hypothetical protein
MGTGNLFVILLYIQLKVLNSNQATKENWLLFNMKLDARCFSDASSSSRAKEEDGVD